MQLITLFQVEFIARVWVLKAKFNVTLDEIKIKNLVLGLDGLVTNKECLKHCNNKNQKSV